jgi:hypothetical protein
MCWWMIVRNKENSFSWLNARLKIDARFQAWSSLISSCQCKILERALGQSKSWLLLLCAAAPRRRQAVWRSWTLGKWGQAIDSQDLCWTRGGRARHHGVVGAALARRSEVVVGFDGASGRGDEDSFSLTDEHVPLWFTIQFADNQNSFNMDGNIPENSSWTSSPVPSSKKLLVTWLQQIHIRFFITSKWILSPLADEPWHHELVNPSGNCSAQRRRWTGWWRHQQWDSISCTSRLGVKMVGINSDTVLFRPFLKWSAGWSESEMIWVEFRPNSILPYFYQNYSALPYFK